MFINNNLIQIAVTNNLFKPLHVIFKPPKLHFSCLNVRCSDDLSNAQLPAAKLPDICENISKSLHNQISLIGIDFDQIQVMAVKIQNSRLKCK